MKIISKDRREEKPTCTRPRNKSPIYLVSSKLHAGCQTISYFIEGKRENRKQQTWREIGRTRKERSKSRGGVIVYFLLDGNIGARV